MLLSTVAVLSGCTLPLPVPSRQEQSAPPSAPTHAALAAIEQGVFVEVNRVRAARGAAVLQRDAALDRAARAHSEELAERGVLDHESTNASRRTPALRAEAEGVSWMRIAENLAAMTDNGSAVPTRTATLWLNSSGHRENMLNAAFTSTGVGVAVDRRGVWYVTQLYVLPPPAR